MSEQERYLKLIEADGTDRFRRLGTILAAVEEHGSLRQATVALGISYRQAWGLLRRVEGLLAEPLLSRRVGGAEGGGADLTEAARDVLSRWRQLQHNVTQILGTPADTAWQQPRPILLASTIGPVEVGLLDRLEAAFHQATGLWVRHIAAGTGQALEIARAGRVDLVLTHAPDAEERFVAEGWGAGRFSLMANDFVVCGPPHDPAGVAGATTAAAAFGRIAAAGSPFLSRADRSGTHTKELLLWQAAGISPAAPWYRPFERGAQGSGITLREADRLGAYTLVDSATMNSGRPEHVAVLFQGDPALANPFSLLSLNAERFPGANHTGAHRFITWATGPDGQAAVAAFGLFDPIA
jgi:tungstate transport system substrate-binding protein